MIFWYQFVRARWIKQQCHWSFPLTINTTCQTLQGTRTAWYYLLIDQPTNFTFQIEPTGNVDYDFAVYVNADCASLGLLIEEVSMHTCWQGIQYRIEFNSHRFVRNGCWWRTSSIHSPTFPGDEVIIVDLIAFPVRQIFSTLLLEIQMLLTVPLFKPKPVMETIVLCNRPRSLICWSFENPINSGIYEYLYPRKPIPLNVTTTEIIGLKLT